MEVIYGLIPGMVILGLIAVGVLFWAARSGQFDDLEGDGQRILMDDDELPINNANNVKQADSSADGSSSNLKDEGGEQDAK